MGGVYQGRADGAWNKGQLFNSVNEKKLEWGVAGDVIEAQRGHQEKNAVRGAYNHAGYLEQRRRLLQKWADYIDGLKKRLEENNERHFI